MSRVCFIIEEKAYFQVTEQFLVEANSEGFRSVRLPLVSCQNKYGEFLQWDVLIVIAQPMVVFFPPTQNKPYLRQNCYILPWFYFQGSPRWLLWSDGWTFICVGSDQVWVMFQKNYKGLKVRQNSSHVGVFQWLFSQWQLYLHMGWIRSSLGDVWEVFKGCTVSLVFM